MFPAAMRLLQIKDLKDLAFLGVEDTIDMQDLTDLKRCFSHERSRGTGHRATVGEAAALLTRSGSGDPELQFSAPNLANRDNLVNPAPDSWKRAARDIHDELVISSAASPC